MVKNMVGVFCLGFCIFINGMGTKPKTLSERPDQHVRIAGAYQQIIFHKRMIEVQAATVAAKKEHMDGKDTRCCIS